MPTYRVIWEIDVDADSQLDAAKQALAIQRDPESTATVFEVSDRIYGPRNREGEYECAVTIDLLNEDGVHNDQS